MTETQGNKRYVNYHMSLIISIINYTIVHVNWTKIICLIQQSIESYKCNAMRTASELRTMNTNCTSICFPGSLHNLSIRSHLEPAPTGCLRAFRCCSWWSHAGKLWWERATNSLPYVDCHYETGAGHLCKSQHNYTCNSLALSHHNLPDPTCMSGTIHGIWNSYSIVGHPVEPFRMVLRVQECMQRLQERARREGTSPSSSSPLLNFSTSHSAVKQ